MFYKGILHCSRSFKYCLLIIHQQYHRIVSGVKIVCILGITEDKPTEISLSQLSSGFCHLRVHIHWTHNSKQQPPIKVYTIMVNKKACLYLQIKQLEYWINGSHRLVYRVSGLGGNASDYPITIIIVVSGISYCCFKQARAHISKYVLYCHLLHLGCLETA